MQAIFSNALSGAVSKHIELSATRRETLSWLTLLIMLAKARSACGGWRRMWRAAQIASVRRRFYRFFQFVRLDSASAARIGVDLLGLHGKPWVLAIDRYPLGVRPRRRLTS